MRWSHIPSQWEGLQGVIQEEEAEEDKHQSSTKQNRQQLGFC